MAEGMGAIGQRYCRALPGKGLEGSWSVCEVLPGDRQDDRKENPSAQRARRSPD